MNSVMERYGPWALITGASSGIGEAFARRLAAEGLNLVLVARREELMKRLADELTSQYSIEIRVIGCDLSIDNFMPVVTERCEDIEIGLLINSAGFATTGTFLENPINRELELLYVNCRAPLLLTHHFGDHMVKRGRGGIVFLGSIVAFSATPLWSQYASSKAFDMMMGEALHEELRDKGIDVLALCPGATDTGFQQVAGIRRFMTMPAEKVAAIGLAALMKGKSMVIPGFINNYNIFCLRFFPRWLNTMIFGKIIKKVRIEDDSHPNSER